AGISYGTYCGLYDPSSFSGNRQGRSGSVGASKKTSGNAFVRKPGSRRSGAVIPGRAGVSAYDAGTWPGNIAVISSVLGNIGKNMHSRGWGGSYSRMLYFSVLAV